jgi:heme-degrading monooxygenase HmoA
MVYLLVRHTVQDYAKWKAVFDEHGKTRKAGGSTEAILYQNVGNPNELVVLTRWATAEAAAKFGSSEDLKATMARAGVMGMPEVLTLREVQRQPA